MAITSGTYSISASGADYVSMQAAFNDIGTMDGALIFEFITDGEVFSGASPLVTSAKNTSVTNTITFQRGTGVDNIYIENTTGSYAIDFLGSITYVTIDGLNISDNAAIGAISYNPGTANTTVQNCTIQGYGLCYHNAGAAHTDNTIKDSIFRGYILEGSGTGVSTDFTISNVVINVSFFRFASGLNTGFLMERCNITVSQDGFLRSMGSGSRFINNKLTFHGTIASHDIQFLTTIDDLLIAHNHWHSSDASALAFYVKTGGNLKIYNNIFSSGDTASQRFFYFETTVAGIRIDGNAYVYVEPNTSTGTAAAFRNQTITTGYATLADFAAATLDGVAHDANSIEITEPSVEDYSTIGAVTYGFRGGTTYPITPNIDNASAFYQAGVDISAQAGSYAVDTDYYGNARTEATPSIGPVEAAVAPAAGGGAGGSMFSGLIG